MSGIKNNFDRKYNFDISSEIKPQQINIPVSNNNNNLTSSISDNQPFQNDKMNIKKIISEIDSIKENPNVLIETSSEEEKKKIIVDSKTYSQNLKRKIKLNYKLFQLFYKNFYIDEFNQTRKSSYFMIGFPCSVILFFSTFLPNHPLFGISLNISAVASIASFIYFYNKDIAAISTDSRSNLGRQIRIIKNELALYNPLAKTVLIEEDNNQKNFKI